MIILIFFILGLIIGSFLNVVVYRLNLAETLLGRSHCSHCQKQIRWYDNIPLLSFILLGAKCRDCQKRISWQYPLLELFTGVIFALVGNYFFAYFDPQSWVQTFYYLVLFALLLIIFAYDWRFLEIPMIVFWIAMGVSVLYYLFSDWLAFNAAFGIWNLATFSGMVGGFLAFLFFFILVSVSRERWMGMGDAYLAFLAGFVMGFPAMVFTLVLAFFLGSVYSLIVLALKKKTLKSQIPFAPFLVSSIIITVIAPATFPSIQYWLMQLF